MSYVLIALTLYVRVLTIAEDEPAIEKPKSKPRATKFKGKKPPEPAIADDSEPEPGKSLNLQYHTLAYSYMTEKSETVKGKVQPTKSRKTPKADVADGSEPGLADDHVADEAEFAKPVAKKRGRPPKIKASAADDAAHTQGNLSLFSTLYISLTLQLSR